MIELLEEESTAPTVPAVAAPVAPAPHKWVVAATVMTGTIMAALDASIVNVALPEMGGTLGATIEEITWVVTGYMLANVILMPLIAWLSARFGRKRVYVASVLLFTAASMCCGLARTLPVMVLFRIVQGAGGGVLMTASQAILREAFPAAEQGVAMGVYGMGVVLAPAPAHAAEWTAQALVRRAGHRRHGTGRGRRPHRVRLA